MEILQTLLKTMALGGGYHTRGYENGAWNVHGVIPVLRNDNRMTRPLVSHVKLPFNIYPHSSMTPPIKMQQTYYPIPQMQQPAQ
jgi:hypothetical protein